LASEFFSDIASTVLSKTLDAEAARQKTIANNIANVETPGYKRQYVSFEEELKLVLERRNGYDTGDGLRDLVPSVRTDSISPSRPDGNNVNIDAEISNLAKASLKYKAAATLLEDKIGLLRSAINGGK
jgi:flagellar basal-body rod protein FlgB